MHPTYRANGGATTNSQKILFFQNKTSVARQNIIMLRREPIQTMQSVYIDFVNDNAVFLKYNEHRTRRRLLLFLSFRKW